MSGFGLTSGSSAENERTRRPSLDFRTTNDPLDTAQDIRSPTPSRLRSEIFTDAFRGLKKAIPSREESSRFTRTPSRLGLKSTGPPSFPLTAPLESTPFSSIDRPPQHVRNLSLQDSLEKPLPVPPPGPTSPLSPNTSARQPHIPHNQKNLGGVFDLRDPTGDTGSQAGADSRPGTMESSGSLPQQGQLHNANMEVSIWGPFKSVGSRKRV